MPWFVFNMQGARFEARLLNDGKYSLYVSTYKFRTCQIITQAQLVAINNALLGVTYSADLIRDLVDIWPESVVQEHFKKCLYGCSSLDC